MIHFWRLRHSEATPLSILPMVAWWGDHPSTIFYPFSGPHRKGKARWFLVAIHVPVLYFTASISPSLFVHTLSSSLIPLKHISRWGVSLEPTCAWQNPHDSVWITSLIGSAAYARVSHHFGSVLHFCVNYKCVHTCLCYRCWKNITHALINRILRVNVILQLHRSVAIPLTGSHYGWVFAGLERVVPQESDCTVMSILLFGSVHRKQAL